MSAAPLSKQATGKFWNMIWEQNVSVISCLIEYYPNDYTYFKLDELEELKFQIVSEENIENKYLKRRILKV